eukprot:SAG31_NODE_51_length_30464_cov_16.835628_4_plen_89_part_00
MLSVYTAVLLAICIHLTSVIATDIQGAERAGEMIEEVYPRMTTEAIRSAMEFDRSATKVMQLVGGIQRMTHGGRCWRINVDLINELVN